MQIIKATKNNYKNAVDAAVEILINGGLVVYPTETCYGIGALAADQNAVDKVLKFKNRPQGKPISIAVYDKNMAAEYVEISALADNLYKEFLPGPVTVVSKSKGKVANGIESEEGKLGIRIPDHIIPLNISKLLGKPFTSTSANLAGGKNPYSVSDILDGLPESKKNMIGLIIDYGQLPENPPSTVVDTTLMDLNVIRAGEIKFGEKTRILDIENESELKKVVEVIFEKYDSSKPLIVLLNGPMGAGKTHLIKVIGNRLEVKGKVNSPTYTIIREYAFGENNLIHIDLWRISREEEIEDLKLGDYFVPGNIIAIEWWGKFEKYFKDRIKNNSNLAVVKVDIEIVDENRRRIIIQ